MISKPRRQTAGFIRTTSHKALPTFNRQQRQNKDESSDQFSSFENCQKVKQDSQSEFSPYKFNNNLSRPPLPHPAQTTHIYSPPKKPANRGKSGSLRNLSNSRSKRDQREQQIQRILKKRAEVENQLTEIGKICQKIDTMNYSPYQSQKKIQHQKRQIKPKVNVNYSFDDHSDEHELENRPFMNKQNNNRNNQIQQDFTLSVNQIKSRTPLLLPKTNKQSQLNHRQQYQFQESSVSSQQKQSRQESSTFNFFQNDMLHQQKLAYRQENTDILKIKHQKARQQFIRQQQESQSDQNDNQESGNGEQLIGQYNGVQFKKTIKQCMQDSPSRLSRHLQPKYNVNPKKNSYGPKIIKNNDVNVQSPGFHKTRGGICFNLDINQFTHQDTQNKSNFVRHQPLKKPKKQNTKEQILKRRQMAKNYDKQARMRVFNHY